MTRFAPFLTLILFSATCSLAVPDYDKVILPLLEEYCYDCHGDGTDKGDIQLDTYKTPAGQATDKALWETVRHNIQQGLMPPEDKAQLSKSQRAQLLQWIDEFVFHVDCKHPKAGRVTYRRLNRVEYNNTVRDLLDIDFEPANDFPPDDTGYGFDNIGDVLSISPMLLEKYARAAEQITDHLAPAAKTVRIDGTDMKGGSGDSIRGSASESSYIYFEFDIQQAGPHTLRLECHGDKGGDEWPKVEAQFDNRPFGEALVDVARDSQKWVEFTTPDLPKGRQTFRARLSNDYYNQKERPGNRDRNVYIHRAELRSPKAKAPEWMRCESGEEKACSEAALRPMMRRAFRRPPSDLEVLRHVEFFDAQIAAGEDYTEAMKLTLQTLLLSPKFLFRGEAGQGLISEHHLASRLSYFLWSTMPDEELLALADRGELRRNLRAQVRRMLIDPKAAALEEHFAGQWLQLRNLDIANPDPKRFPSFTPQLRDSMRRETELLFQHIREQNRPILDLVAADYTYLDQRLAAHYGLKGFKGDEFQFVRMHDGRRGGILTHAGILTITSFPTRTSPVVRGAWVLETLLGAPPPPPPQDVPELPEGDSAEETGSMRERLEKHRDNPNCASCHRRIDPIGFGLEHFDAIGAWRDTDNGHPIDDAGKLSSGQTFNGHVELRNLLARDLADPFARCMTEHMLTYALGRGLTHQDVCVIDEIANTVKDEDYRFFALIDAIVNSIAFQQQDAPPAE